MTADAQYVLNDSASRCSGESSSRFVDAWTHVLSLAKRQFQGEALAQGFVCIQACSGFPQKPTRMRKLENLHQQGSFLVVLNHGDDHASIGFVGSGERAFVMLSINDTALDHE